MVVVQGYGEPRKEISRCFAAAGNFVVRLFEFCFQGAYQV